MIVTVTRATLIQKMALRLGGHYGTLSFTSGVSNRAVLNGQVGTSNDDSFYVGWHLFMLDAANESDRERTITLWDASTGTAGWEVARTDTTSHSETYIIASPDFSLDDYRQAINKALVTAKRSARYVLPTVPGIMDYSLDRLTWLEGADDIDDITLGQSPNWLHNEDFEFWQNGSALAPDGWTLAGSGASVARSSTGIRSPYAASVTRASVDATLYQDIPPALVQYLVRSTSAPLPVLSFGAWVTSSTASIARVGIYNGSSTTWSSYHTGTGVPQFLSSTYQTTATDTAIRFVCSVDTSAGTSAFHATVLVPQASLPAQMKDRGSKSYDEFLPMNRVRNTGDWPVVELASDPGYRQLIVTSRRPFPTMTVSAASATMDSTGDTETVENQYGDAIIAWALRWMMDAEVPNVDRTRLDRIRGEEANKATRATQKFISKPVQPPVTSVRIGGA